MHKDLKEFLENECKIDFDTDEFAKKILEKKEKLSVYELEKDLYEQSCKNNRKIMAKIIESLDDEILNNRDKDIYIPYTKIGTTLKTVMGDVEYKRRLYKYNPKIGKKNVFLLDDFLEKGDFGIGRVSGFLVEKIVNSATNMSFRKVVEQIQETYPNVYLCTQTVWNIVQEYSKRLEEVQLKKLKNRGKKKRLDVLFQEADGVYLKIQKTKGKSKELKVGICYEGWKKRNGSPNCNEYVTHNKTVYASFNNKKFWGLNEKIIDSEYDLEFVKHIVFNGDGAGWISEGAGNVIFQLDRFHIKQAMVRAYGTNKKRMKALERLLYDGEIEALLDEIENDMYRSEKYVGKSNSIEQLYEYLTSNKAYILRYNERGFDIPKPPKGLEYRNLGTMESNIATVIAPRMKGNRSLWSIPGAENMARILCAKYSS